MEGSSLVRLALLMVWLGKATSFFANIRGDSFTHALLTQEHTASRGLLSSLGETGKEGGGVVLVQYESPSFGGLYNSRRVPSLSFELFGNGVCFVRVRAFAPNAFPVHWVRVLSAAAKSGDRDILLTLEPCSQRYSVHATTVLRPTRTGTYTFSVRALGPAVVYAVSQSDSTVTIVADAWDKVIPIFASPVAQAIIPKQLSCRK